MRILNTAEVEAILATLSPSDLLASQTHVFRLFSAPPSPDAPSASTLPVHAAGQVDPVQLPPRLATFSSEGRTLYMPSYVEGLGSGVKVLTRTASGMKTNMMLIAPEGGVEAVIECKALTAVRNAAGSALFLQSIGMTPRKAVFFGSGDQARAHLRLFKQLWPDLERTVVVRRDPAEPLGELAENVILATDAGVKKALKEANVIVTATPATQPLFTVDALRPSAALVLLGSSRPDMCEVPPSLLRSSRVIVDSKEACLREAGEIIQASLTAEDLTELGELLATKGDGDESDGDEGRPTGKEGESVVFKSVGLGMQDLAINRLVLKRAEEMDIGTVI